MRPQPASSALRWGRAALLAAVALGTGVVAHVSAQGRMPGPVALLVLYAVVTATAASLLGRAAGTTRIVLLLIAGQTLVHGALTAMSGHRGDPPLQRAAGGAVVPVPRPVVTGASRRGSYYDLAYAGGHPTGTAPLTVPAPVQHVLADLTGPHAAMALAHLAAAAVVGLWLAVGERALWSLVTLLLDEARADVRGRAGALTALALLAAVSARLRPRPRPRDVRRDPPRPGRVLVRAVQRRGPPVLLAG